MALPPKGRRAQKLARRAVEKGLLTESQLREARIDEATTADLSSVIERGWLTHAQLQQLGGDESHPTAAKADEHEAGEAIGKYVLLRQIGSGGMGTVWLASDAQLDRFVAIKFLRDPSPEDAQRFQREARLAAKLNHPNIAAVYEFGELDGHPYLVMQYVEGKTLLDLRPPPQRTMKICRDAARALEVAHRDGIVHRDIKPHNIMVDKTGRVYIMDFGVAKRVSFVGTRTPSHVRPMDSVGDESDMIFGTPSYMSPEQVDGSVDIDGRTDVYCLGATMYHVLTGVPVFQGSTISEILDKVISRSPTAPSKVSAGLAYDVDAIVLKCLQKIKSKRYETARALADDIDRFLRGEPVEAANQTVKYRLSKHRSRVLWYGTAGAAFGALILAAWLLMRSSEGRTTPESLVREGEAAMAAGRLDEAELKFNRALELKKEFEPARQGLTGLRMRRRDAMVAEVDKAIAERNYEAARILIRNAETYGVDPTILARWEMRLQGPGRLTVRGADVRVVDEKGAPADALALPPGRYTAILGERRVPFAVRRLPTGEGESIAWELPTPVPGMAILPRAGSLILGTWLDHYEVTTRQYQEFVKTMPESERALFEVEGAADAPVAGLDEIQAVRFLLAAGKRLPLASEWLAAAQGVDDRAYPWGSSSSVLASIDKPCGIQELAKVDVSPFAVVGMASGATEPVWGDAAKGGPVWPSIAWAGGHFGGMKDPVRFKVTTEPGAWSSAAGLRGAKTSLSEKIRRDAGGLEKLMQGKDLAARIEATNAAVELGEPAVAIKQAAWDPSPFVAYPALKDLVKRGEDLSKLFSGSTVPVGTLYLAALAGPRAELCAELERRYSAAFASSDRATQVATCMALLYLGAHEVNGRQILGETRALCVRDDAPNGALSALYLRYAFRPGFDLGAVIDDLLGKDGEAVKTQALGIFEDVLGRMESGQTPKEAYGASAKRPAILALTSSDELSSKTRERARRVLERMDALGL